MANRAGKIIDGTDLDLDQAEERMLIHRDYLKHCLAWSHIAMEIRKGNRYKTARVLDVGCGSDRPLPRMLHSNRLLVEEYVGIDYNPEHKFKEREFGSFNGHFYGSTIFPRDVKIKGGSYTVKDGPLHKLPNLIVSLEVLEHVKAAHALVMLKAMHKLASLGDAEVIISTPVWDVDNTAANHINEMRHAALGTAMEDVGFAIEKNYGTFGSLKDYKDAFIAKYGAGGAQLLADMREYHDTNIISNMFCSQFPGLARNALWHLRPAKEGYVRKFPRWEDVPTPWTSDETTVGDPGDWRDLSGPDGYKPQ